MLRKISSKIPPWIVFLSVTGTGVGAFVIYKDRRGGAKFESDVRIPGRTVIVTGANSGFGKHVSKEMAKRGGRVIMACRNMKQCSEVKEEIMEGIFNKNIVCKKLDLSSLQSIRDFAKDINENEKRIDILINNAGCMGFKERELTKEGFEMHLGVNHLGPFLLTNLLLEKLIASGDSRIVNVSSANHHQGRINFDDLNCASKYVTSTAYSQSKLANVLFTRELAERLKDTGVHTYAVNPGVSLTNIGRHMSMNNSMLSSMILKPFWSVALKTPEQGAQSILYAALEPSIAEHTGKYYENCELSLPSERAMNRMVGRRLWAVSEAWTRLAPTKSESYDNTNAQRENYSSETNANRNPEPV